MGARAFLARARAIEAEIEALTEERRRLHELLTSGVQRLTGMPRGGGGDWTAAAARIADIDGEIAEDIERLKMTRVEVHNVIDMVDDPDLHRLLVLRYRGGYTWRQVANRMPCDERTCYRLYKRALRAVEEILRED